MWVMSEHAVRDQRTVARMMGISKTRVRQLEEKALMKLALKLSARGYGEMQETQAVAK